MRTIGDILSTRSIDALKRLNYLLTKSRWTERECLEARTLRKTLNIKSLALKGSAILSVTLLSGCAVANRNGFHANAGFGITAVEHREERIVSRASSNKPLICEWFPQRCEAQEVSHNDK